MSHNTVGDITKDTTESLRSCSMLFIGKFHKDLTNATLVKISFTMKCLKFS